MCLTLDNGSHVWPARRWSPFYIQCTSQRTIPTACQGPSVMYNFFQDTCQFVYEVVNAAYSLSLSLDIPESLYHLISPMPTKFMHQPTQEILTTRPPAASTDIQLTNFVSKTDTKTSPGSSFSFPLSHSIFGGELFDSRGVLLHTTPPSGDLSLFTAARTESYLEFFSTELFTMAVSSLGENSYSKEESLMLLPSSVLVVTSSGSSPSSTLFTDSRRSTPSSILVIASSRSSVSTEIETISKTPVMTTSQIKGYVTEEIKLFGNVTYLSESITVEINYMSDMTTLMPTPSSAKSDIMSTLDRNADLQSTPSADPSEVALPSKSMKPFKSLITRFKESELFPSYDFVGSSYSTSMETSTPIAPVSDPAKSIHTVEALKSSSALCFHADCTVSATHGSASNSIFSLESSVNTLAFSSSQLSSYISPPSPSLSLSSIASSTLMPFSTYSVLLNDLSVKSLSSPISPSSTKRLPLNLPSSSLLPDKSSNVSTIDNMSTHISKNKMSFLQSDVYISDTKEVTISTESYTSELPYTTSIGNNFMPYSFVSRLKTGTSHGIASSTIFETSSTRALITSHTGYIKEQVFQSFTISNSVDNGTVSPYISATSVKEPIISNISISSFSSLLLSLSSEVTSTTSISSTSESSEATVTSSMNAPFLITSSVSAFVSSFQTSTQQSLSSSFSSPSSSHVNPTSSFRIISSHKDKFPSESMIQLSSSLFPPMVISSNLSSSQFLVSSPTSTEIPTSNIDNIDVLTKRLTESIALFTSLTHVKYSLSMFASKDSDTYQKMSTVNVHESIHKHVLRSSKMTESESATFHQTQSVTKVKSTNLSPSSVIIPFYSEQLTVSLTSRKIRPTESLGILSTESKFAPGTESTVIKPSRPSVDSSSMLESPLYFSSSVSPSTVTVYRNTASTKQRGKSSELRKNEITSIAIGVGVGGGIFIIIIAFVVVILVLRKRKKRGRKDFFQIRLPPELFMSRRL